VRILFIADIYARPGRRVAAQMIPRLIREREVDFCIANGENGAGGFGLTENIARKLHNYGVDVITSGNHIWNRADFTRYLIRNDRALRPLNYPVEAPGSGSTMVPSRTGTPVAVINLQGRTFMPSIDCPFKVGAAEVDRLKKETPVVFVDFHAEATAEKVAMGRHLDGRASAVIGTHTHVQTADECILDKGTAYLTDAGMTGTHDSVIGTRAEIAIGRFLSQVPTRFKPAEGPATLCGVLLEVDEATGVSTSIQRLQLKETTDDMKSSAGDEDGD
jgi:metallophosphoesterase (TIGR00282 family)